jgi:electron transfer flavoprotein beta subunit
MHSVVCLKQVPDSAQIRIHPVTNTIMRQGVPTIINPYDLFALEEALRLRDRFGGRVTVMTMGPPMAEAALRKALAYGADAAVLMTDRVFAGSDTLATSYVLASGIAKIAAADPVDIVFAGKQTIDGDTAQVGPGIASRMKLNQLTYVERIVELEMDTHRIVVHRRAEGGVQVLATRLPCLVTMLEGTNEIRFASMDDMFRAARAEITTWSAADAGIEDVGKCGLRGSPTVVRKVFAPKPRTEKATPIDVAAKSPAEIADAVIETLEIANPKLHDDLLKQARAG